jgi:hypothetical protein
MCNILTGELKVRIALRRTAEADHFLAGLERNHSTNRNTSFDNGIAHRRDE